MRIVQIAIFVTVLERKIMSTLAINILLCKQDNEIGFLYKYFIFILVRYEHIMCCLKKQEYLVHISFYSQASGLMYIERRNKPYMCY